MFLAARDGTVPPMTLTEWRPYTTKAHQTILTVRDAALQVTLSTTDATIASAFERLVAALGTLLLVLVSIIAITALFSRRVVLPLGVLARTITQLVHSRLDVKVPATGRADEIGKIARAVDVLKLHGAEAERLQGEREDLRKQAELERSQGMERTADQFGSSVGGIVGHVMSAAGSFEEQAAKLASMAREADRRSTEAARLAQSASQNIEAVAGAAEELSASIGEIRTQLRGRRLRSRLPAPRDRALHDQILHPENQRHGRALQWSGVTRGARHHYLQPLRSGDPAGGLNVAYNGRRQRILKGLSPEMVLHQRLKDNPALARTAAKKADPAALDHALKVVADVKEVSQPDSTTLAGDHWPRVTTGLAPPDRSACGTYGPGSGMSSESPPRADRILDRGHGRPRAGLITTY